MFVASSGSYYPFVPHGLYFLALDEPDPLPPLLTIEDLSQLIYMYLSQAKVLQKVSAHSMHQVNLNPRKKVWRSDS